MRSCLSSSMQRLALGGHPVAIVHEFSCTAWRGLVAWGWEHCGGSPTCHLSCGQTCAFPEWPPWYLLLPATAAASLTWQSHPLEVAHLRLWGVGTCPFSLSWPWGFRGPGASDLPLLQWGPSAALGPSSTSAEQGWPLGPLILVAGMERVPPESGEKRVACSRLPCSSSALSATYRALEALRG